MPVTLLLERDAPEMGEAWRAQPAPERTSGHSQRIARILVVEDDRMVRAVLERLLREAGYDVETAWHGGQALERLGDGDPPYDLVVTDMRMPVLDGRELGHRIAARWPRLPVLYISGFDVEPEVPRIGRTSPPFLRKPFDPDELLRKVARMLR